MAKWLMVGWLVLGSALFIAVAFLTRLPHPLGLTPEHFFAWCVLPAAIVWALLYLVPVGLMIADVVRLSRRRDLLSLREGALAVKIAGIPYFTLFGALITLVTLAAMFLMLFSSHSP